MRLGARTFRSPACAARTMSSFCQISGDASAALQIFKNGAARSFTSYELKLQHLNNSSSHR